MGDELFNIRKLAIFIFLLLISTIACSRTRSIKKNDTGQVAAAKLETKLANRRIILPNGWSLSPAGQSIPLGDLPLNMALSTDQNRAAVTLNGYGKEGVKIINTKSHSVEDSVFLKSAWVGLAFGHGDSLLYASGGNTNQIYVITHQNSKWVKKDSIALGKSWPKDKISPAGVAVDVRQQRLYTVTKEDSALYIVNLKSRQVIKRVKLPAAAYTCRLTNDGQTLYVSLWDGKAIAVYDVETQSIWRTINVESHPNDMVLTSDDHYLYVANANSNSVSVIDTQKHKVVETLNAALYANAPTGSTTNSVALSASGQRLYVANADNNCLAVFDVSQPGQSRSLGYIPTGWYPTSVKVVDNQILVANGKSNHSEANPKGPNPTKKRTADTQYIAGLLSGNLSFIKVPDAAEMGAFSKQVYKNTPYDASNSTDNEETAQSIFSSPGQASRIKHVFYIIKENRTYDQVLGDMPEGNGDPNLTLFGEQVTPNHHKLAREFVLLDNFYVDAEVSADGHNWSTGAYATDYVEKTWPTYYSGRGGNYDYEGGREIAYPEKGFIWNYCKRAGISYRSYGEFTSLGEAHLKVLENHIDSDYPGFDLSIKDVYREKIWEHDFDSLLAHNAVPRFQTIRLPDDHTAGASKGSRTPKAYVADNDLALGRLIDHLSHSAIWGESIVFVLEDDAQNGPDHVDAHRSVCLVAGPNVKRGAAIHAMYSTSSVLHTMERILGLLPMSQYDAAAPVMSQIFAKNTSTQPYNAAPNRIPLDKINTADNELSRISKQFNLAKADAAPDVLFDEVIWKTIRGPKSVMPPPRHSAFLNVHAKENEEMD